MHRERPLIHFCLDRDADQRSLHTYFELGVRIGRPFAIHRTPGTIPSDAVAVIAQSQAANLKAPVLCVQENAASGDLIRTGATGTNVTDLVLGLRWGPGRA